MVNISDVFNILFTAAPFGGVINTELPELHILYWFNSKLLVTQKSKSIVLLIPLAGIIAFQYQSFSSIFKVFTVPSATLFTLSRFWTTFVISDQCACRWFVFGYTSYKYLGSVFTFNSGFVNSVHEIIVSFHALSTILLIFIEYCLDPSDSLSSSTSLIFHVNWSLDDVGVIFETVLYITPAIYLELSVSSSIIHSIISIGDHPFTHTSYL